MSEPVKPALTPEEWAVQADDSDPSITLRDRMWWAADEAGLGSIPEHRHALAALALHEQDFGFTHADVALLRRMGEQTRTIILENPEMYERIKHRAMDTPEMWEALADRIAALLPPEP